jgi:hypothetical protein
MKKLAVFLMIPALVLLAASTASAFYFHPWGGIYGDYAVTGTGNCLWSPKLPTGEGGFDAQLQATGPFVFGSHFTVNGVWHFEPDGTGNTTFTQFGIVPPSPKFPPTVPYPNAASLEFSFKFTYTLTRDGLITVEMLPDTFEGNFLTGPNANQGKTFKVDKAKFVGRVSWDHNTLTLNTENEFQQFTQHQNGTQISLCPVICNSGRVLIRVGF